MATEYSALMEMRLLSTEKLDPTVDPGASGQPSAEVSIGSGGVRWKNGGGNGQIQRNYKRIRTIGSGATDSYDLLAAGSLTTPNGESIDLDEVKGLILRVTAGEVKFVKATTGGLDCFTAADEGMQLGATAALQALGLYFGADGLDVTTNSKFAIIETSGAGTATYELEFIGAE